MNKEIKAQKTVAEAIEEIKSKMFSGEHLTTDTMLIALGALVAFEGDKE
jgi:hypothetical protein